MSISSISGVSPVQFEPVQFQQATNSTQRAPQSADSDNDGDTGAKVSPRGKFLSELQQLSQTDPAKFKQVTAEIAAKLQAAAQNQTGGDSQSLNALADKFKAASQSGNFSDVAPSPSAAGAAHGHHHHHGASAYSQQQLSAQSDTQSLASSIFSLVDTAATGASGTTAQTTA